LINVPLADPKLDNAFKNQILCSPDLFQNDTVVLFMHDLGNLRAEASAISADIPWETAFIIDTSRKVVDWALDNKYAIMDVNIIAHLSNIKSGHLLHRPDEAKQEARLAMFIWANFIQICPAKRVVLIGHGTGCQALMTVLNRAKPIDRVKACAFVLGFEMPPETEPYSGLKTWYRDTSLVILPAMHDLLDDRFRIGKINRKYGNVVQSSEARPIKVLAKAWNDVKTFIDSKLAQPPPTPLQPMEVEGREAPTI